MRNGNGKRPPAETTNKVIRCAIYTRKSTDEGLQQEFNSLDAQREAAEAFIQSQRHEGWQLVADRYDDGGFSGGDMDRPALKRLLAGIEARKIDCVVVYKVDRLSRSLLDFARIMERFDRNNVRDKMCAARRKGKWVGGHPVLGYDIDSRGGKLIVNPDEARQVRKIFDLYLEHEALLPVLQELERRTWRMKRWTTKDGILRGGTPFTKGRLHSLLTNVIYLGKVDHKGAIYAGEHEAIIAPTVWEQVRKTLQRNGRTSGASTRNRYGALLRGLLYCVPCGVAMIHSYTARKSKRYRYYVCYQAQQRGWKNCETKSISAPAIEAAVLESIRRLGADPALAAETARQARSQLARRVGEIELDQTAAQKQLRQLNAELVELAGDGTIQSSERLDRLVSLQKEIEAAEQRLSELIEELQELRDTAFDEQELEQALKEFDPVWNSLTTREQAKLVHLLIEKVGYDGRTGKVTVSFRSAGLKELCNNGKGDTKTERG